MKLESEPYSAAGCTALVLYRDQTHPLLADVNEDAGRLTDRERACVAWGTVDRELPVEIAHGFGAPQVTCIRTWATDRIGRRRGD